MKKQFIVLASVVMLFAIIIASCSKVQGNLGDVPSERSIGIVEPPDFPAEYRALLDECEDLYNKMQEDPSYEAQLTEKRVELQKLQEKYGIKSMTDEEMQEDILKHSGANREL